MKKTDILVHQNTKINTKAPNQNVLLKRIIQLNLNDYSHVKTLQNHIIKFCEYLAHIPITHTHTPLLSVCKGGMKLKRFSVSYRITPMNMIVILLLVA